MNSSQYTIYIIDDDEAVRDSLCMLVDSVGLACRSFASAQDFLHSYQDSFTGCLITDVRMPGLSGLQLQEILREREIPLPIIFLTGNGDIPMAVKAIKAGAIDFMSKPFRDQELLDCIQKALIEFSKIQNQLITKNSITTRLSTLTIREKDILRSVVDGKSNKNIADEFNLSQRTVEAHRANVMKKMQTHSVAELVKLVSSLEY